MTIQADIDQRNAAFWDELCGTGLAKAVGITGDGPDDLKQFDDAYLALYPYLLSRIPVATFSGKRVLEVGLGYGTLGQAIASHCASYIGLDIAAGPVRMMNHRLEMAGIPDSSALQGSMLEAPFPDSSFDVVASVGCFHHTGNVQRCIDETWRVLKPGGHAYIMVYNALSYRNWMQNPGAAAKVLFARSRGGLNDAERWAYDSNAAGDAAPETVFTSRRQLKQMFSRFSSYSVTSENWNGLLRPMMLGTLARLIGLDLYVTARK